MLKMSFYHGTLDREKAKEEIMKTNKKILYTYGLKYRNPSTYLKEISKDKAIEIINRSSFLNIDEKAEIIDLNEYSANDLF